MARLTFALAVALLGVAGARAAEEPTFTACTTDNDCVSDANAELGQTQCGIFSQYDWTDTSGTTPVNHHVQWGFCKQCSSDCDCGVNEWCAIGLSPPTSQWWSATDEAQMSAGDLAQMKQILASFQTGNFKGQGKCLEYGAADDESERIGLPCNPGQQMSGTTSNDPKHATYMSTCGYVSNWQPEYLDCKASDGGAACLAGDARTKNAGWNTPGVCAGLVSNAPVVGCSASGTWWDGACVDKTCQICKDGATRCGSGSGISQICIGGKWAPKFWEDDTPRTANGNVFVQLEASLLAFLSLILVIGCLSCLATARAAKNMAAAASD